MSGQRVSTGIYLGDKLVKPIFGNQFMGINPFFQPEATPVLTNSVLMLDATSTTSYPGTGNNWFDLSGNGNNADVTEVTSYWNAGGYFDWPGTDYTKIATVAADSSFNQIFGSTSSWTMMFVGTIDATAGGFADLAGGYAVDDFNDNPGLGWLIIRNSADGNYRKMNFYINGLGIGLSSGLIFDTIGDWFVLHVVKSTTNVTYYNTSNTSIGSASNSSDARNSNGLTIGRARNDATANYKWDGKIAGVGIYNTALTSDQRLENINYFKSKLGF
jgi:hypothetical protein